MNINEIRQFIKDKAATFGAKVDSGSSNNFYIERNNTGGEALKDGGAFFGLIHPDEESSGPYHDFSLTIFPSAGEKPWLVCLGVGSSGFRNDYELATYPGLRRLFSQLINEEGFCKSDFSDIESSLPKFIASNDKLTHIKNTIKTYTKVLPVCQIVDDPLSTKGKEVIAAFVAAYAKLRDWPSNNDQRKAVAEALGVFSKDAPEDNDVERIEELLSERKYIILQGAPGTGKTRTAKKVSEKPEAKTFFTQFHAETSYSDFIYGIRPDTDNQELRYKESRGIFAEAVQYAKEHKDKKVVLIIDEINRANLSNVLGPIFYLFEHKMETSDISIEIVPGLSINKLPDNFFVIGTMNTADRSLAVVDFALRRRFAWYTMRPKAIKSKDFYKKDFEDVQAIFNWYASDLELTLQPGQGYFIANTDEEMKNRIRYELYPLVKEYIQEGLLHSAKEEFNDYFCRRINQSLFE